MLLFALLRPASRRRLALDYVVTALTALYLDCFLAVVQSFQNLSFLTPLAPTQSKPPF